MLNLLGHLLILTNPFLRANEKLFISKALRWAILLRSRIKNLCLKNKADLIGVTMKIKGISVQIFVRIKRSTFINST